MFWDCRDQNKNLFLKIMLFLNNRPLFLNVSVASVDVILGLILIYFVSLSSSVIWLFFQNERIEQTRVVPKLIREISHLQAVPRRRKRRRKVKAIFLQLWIFFGGKKENYGCILLAPEVVVLLSLKSQSLLAIAS